MKAGALLVALLVVTTNAPVAAPLYPLVSGWEQWFRIESEASIQGGKSVVSGTVWNTSGWGLKHVQLLVEGLDTEGKPVNQRVVWLGPALPKGTHTYFEVPMPASASYRVSVFAFDGALGKQR